jgi:hypothetical protein
MLYTNKVNSVRMHLRSPRIPGTPAALLFVLLVTGLNTTAQQHPNPTLYRRKTDSIAAARHGTLAPDTTIENRLVALALQAPPL